MNDYFIFGTLNQVCINEKCDSMYGWYGFNAQITWKIIYFGWFLIIFRTFGAQIWPHILSKHHINDYLIFGTLHSIVYVPMINLIPCMGDMALMPKLCEKYAIFWWFLMIFGTFGAHIWPHILSWHHINDYFIFWTLKLCMFQWVIWFNVWVICL